MIKILLRIYQYAVMLPLLFVVTVLTTFVTIAGCSLGGGRWFGYWPAHIWARVFCWLSLVRVRVHGREHIKSGRSYVFVANHQSAYDIFAVYGWLNHQFLWMMKKSLERIPLVGFSCRKCGHIFVDNSSRAGVRQTMEDAEKRLAGGRSVVVFPEGTRTKDGHMNEFHRGAYLLAVNFALPVVPLSIDGAFDVLTPWAKLPSPGTITLTIHKPIEPVNGKHANTAKLMDDSRAAIASALPERNR